MPNNEEQSNTVIAEKSKIKSIIDPESIHVSNQYIINLHHNY